MAQTDHRMLQRRWLAPQFGWIKQESLLNSQRLGLKLVYAHADVHVCVCVRSGTTVHALDTDPKDNISRRLWQLIWITWHKNWNYTIQNVEVSRELTVQTINYRLHKVCYKLGWWGEGGLMIPVSINRVIVSLIAEAGNCPSSGH